jgi:hypothetical protein
MPKTLTWNNGILGLSEYDLFLYRWDGLKNKNRHRSAFDPQYSIIPPFHYSIGRLKVNLTSTGLPDQGSLLFCIQSDRHKIIFYIFAIVQGNVLFLQNAFNRFAVCSTNVFIFQAGFACIRQRADVNEITFHRR